MTKFLVTHTGQKLAYSFTKGVGPAIIFLGGFKSDMEGSKAIFLEKWAKKRNRSFYVLIILVMDTPVVISSVLVLGIGLMMPNKLLN